MKTTAMLLACALMACMTPKANAALVDWQDAVDAAGAVFSEINIGGPTTRDIGVLTGAKTYEMIINAPDAGNSVVAIGKDNQGDPGNSATRQGLKFEQGGGGNNNYGATYFGVVDINSGAATTYDQDVVLSWVVDPTANGGGGNITVFEDGIQVAVMNTAVPFGLNGEVGVGQGFRNGNSFFDIMPASGNILGLASFDRALTADEIALNFDRFVNGPPPVPEPATATLALLGAAGLMRRRRNVA